jgi:altronate hydrolase
LQKTTKRDVTAGIPLLRIHPSDNVAVALRTLEVGEALSIGGWSIKLCDTILPGHKVALDSIADGQVVRKYGCPIGQASAAIRPGEHVHSHNLRTGLTAEDTFVYSPNASSNSIVSEQAVRTFQGYRRADGRVGTRNEIWILCTVGCMNRSVERIARLSQQQFPNRCDGIFAFTHPFGCSQLGDDLQNTRRLLAGLIRNPNAGGVLVVGLGCENNQMTALLEEVGMHEPHRLRTFIAQDVEDELETGLATVGELLDAMSDDRRETCPVSDLVLGVKCGGSDGFSGISANPTVGRALDMHCGLNGRALLSEVPEMFGAEQILLDRAVSESVYQDVVDMVGDFKAYFVRYGQPVYENPSPGNIDGGLTTLEEKSLGAIQKGGTAPIVGVLHYGEPLVPESSPGGLTLVEAPGNDTVSCTALVAAGATIVLFTTGRGTPLGAPVPTIKIASNSELAVKKPHWIDFNCGILLEGAVDDKSLSESLYHDVCAVASGGLTRNETNDYREIAIWKEGVTL